LPTDTLCRAAETRLGASDVRRAASSADSGSGNVISPIGTNEGVYASE
jgi:hypothetical protein